MPAEIILQQTPDDAALADKREELAHARERLAEREADVAQYRAQLKAFESRYFHRVGVLYAELDEIEARIVEREVDLYNSEAARTRAAEARQRAEESRAAAAGEESEPQEFEPPPSLKTLFRDVAKRIHPDFARDDAERRHFTLLMARANLAYRRGDNETLQRLLDDHVEVHDSLLRITRNADAAAELMRITRQIGHAERDIAVLEAERTLMLASDIGQFHVDAEAVANEHRDLLAELAAAVREQIAEALGRFEFINRQITAHGR